jgi:hypothetical protein
MFWGEYLSVFLSPPRRAPQCFATEPIGVTKEIFIVAAREVAERVRNGN